MVQLATTADDGDEPFAAFEALLPAEYPRAHARLAADGGTGARYGVRVRVVVQLVEP